MRKITFSADKGGVGKTTTVCNLAVGLSKRGHKILVVDMDEQGDATWVLLGQRPPRARDLKRGDPLPPSTRALLTGLYTLEQVTVPAPRYPNLFIVPSNRDTQVAAQELVPVPGSHSTLYRVVKNLPEELYDFVLIDTGKGGDILVTNSLAAADEVYIMVVPGRLEIDAIRRTIDLVGEVQRNIFFGEKHPVVAGLILTRTDHYTVTTSTHELIEQTYPGLLLRTSIPKNIDLEKATGRATSIFDFTPNASGAIAYAALVEEIINHGK